METLFGEVAHVLREMRDVQLLEDNAELRRTALRFDDDGVGDVRVVLLQPLSRLTEQDRAGVHDQLRVNLCRLFTADTVSLIAHDPSRVDSQMHHFCEWLAHELRVPTAHPSTQKVIGQMLATKCLDRTRTWAECNVFACDAQYLLMVRTAYVQRTTPLLCQWFDQLTGAPQ